MTHEHRLNQHIFLTREGFNNRDIEQRSWQRLGVFNSLDKEVDGSHKMGWLADAVDMDADEIGIAGVQV